MGGLDREGVGGPTDGARVWTSDVLTGATRSARKDASPEGRCPSLFVPFARFIPGLLIHVIRSPFLYLPLSEDGRVRLRADEAPLSRPKAP